MTNGYCPTTFVVVFDVAVSLPFFAVAVLLRLVPALALRLTTRLIVAGSAKLITVLVEQVTTWETAAQVKPSLPEPETKDSPAGKVSETVTVPDVAPPVLDTARL